MKEEQCKQIVAALTDFIIRVANGKATSETEVAVLPEVVKALKIISE